LLDDAKVQLGRILEETKNSSCISLIGMPLGIDNQLLTAPLQYKKEEYLVLFQRHMFPTTVSFTSKGGFLPAEETL